MSLTSVHYTDERGYGFVEASDSWKDLCSHLPCFAGLCWDNYDTKVIDTAPDGKSPLVIDGQEVIIQLWKGRIPKAKKLPDDILGGVGAEVGVYRSHDFLSRWLREHMNMPAQAWWAYEDLGATLEYELVNPVTNETFFKAKPETTYWLCKWMDPGSYDKYVTDQKQKVAKRETQYRMTATITGKNDKKKYVFTF